MVAFELPAHLEDADIDEISERADELYDELKLYLDPHGPLVAKAFELSAVIEYLRLNYDLVKKDK